MSDWKSTQLGDLCDPARGITYGIVKVGDYIPGGIPVVRGGDIRDGRIVFNEEKRVSSDVSNQFKRTILRGDEIVLNLIAEPGHSALVPTSMVGYNVSRDVAVIALIDQVNSAFVNYFLRSPVAIEWLTARLQGSVTQKINLGTLRQVPVPMPSRTYQDAVTAVLGALEDKIESNVLAIRTANELARAIFEAMFEQQDSAGLVRLGDLADVIDCLHSRKPQFVDGGHRYLVLADIRDDSRLAPFPNFTISEENYIDWTRRIEAREGDCLVTNVGRVGAVGQIPHGVTAAIGRNMTAIRGRQECPPAYLVEALRSGTVRREIDVKTDQGTVMSALNVRSIPNLLIPARSLPDRQAFQDRAGGLHGLQDQLLQENARLTIMRDMLLPKLMSGEIRLLEAERVVEDAT